MKTLKNYAMALVALVIAATSVTLMSFGENNLTAKKIDDLRWFTVEENPLGGGYIYSSGQSGGHPSPEAGCENEDITTLCAVAFPSTELGSNGMPNELDPENAESQNKRYKDDQ